MFVKRNYMKSYNQSLLGTTVMLSNHPEFHRRAKHLAFRVFCFTVIFFSMPISSWAQEKSVGKIIGLTGFVEILVSEPVAQVKKGEVKNVSAEVWQQLKKKQPVYKKDTFRTGRKSRLKILFEDKSLMALGPRTRMSVESYLFKPEDKLRQGVINVAHGLSMYIVNKSQKNKKSSFRIVSPTGNLAARGTHGYISVSPDKTLIANQAGSIIVSNSDPNVGLEKKAQWFEENFKPVFTTAAFNEDVGLFAQVSGGLAPGEVMVNSMEKTTVEEGQLPSDPVPLTPAEVQTIRNVVLAKIGVSSENKELVKVEGKKTVKKKDDKDDGDEGGDEGGDVAGGDADGDAGGDEGGDSDFASEFEEGGLGSGDEGGGDDSGGGGGGSGDFAETA
jgi:hypothetical protein